MGLDILFIWYRYQEAFGTKKNTLFSILKCEKFLKSHQEVSIFNSKARVIKSCLAYDYIS
ncbi:MAG: hypothetical protein A2X86_09215 [Bdellovibrionales bacterium GWA2_49_15]|nr:MAG: hypothetical protein A2X86_09215 [Bdellovibrionales bacterium GWA2_49_15]HAZ12957.1 hypothetical protein [Bdellovibrionales bacterium]